MSERTDILQDAKLIGTVHYDSASGRTCFTRAPEMYEKPEPSHNQVVRELHDRNYVEELELSPVQRAYEDWRFAEERRARVAWRQRRFVARRWLRHNAGVLKFVAALVGMMALEVVGLLYAAHCLGIKVW